MKDKINGVQKFYKTIAKKMGNGDLKSFRRGIVFLESAVAGEACVSSTMKELEASSSSREHLGGGELVAQMPEACGELGVDVKGKFPVYEMFSHRVKIDAENQDLYLDRKKIQCMRPKSFARRMKAGQDKSMKASFNVPTLANELADVYDLALLKLKRQPKTDTYLIDLYKLLTPMGRFRRDYDQQSYTLDLARLYGSGIKEIKDGRRIQLDPSREGDKAIRALDSQGRKEYLLTICFFR